MRRELPRRIERLEQRARIVAGPPPPDIFLCFGDDYTAVQAKSGQREWNRKPDEDHEQFKDRIIADLKTAHDAPPHAVLLFNLESFQATRNKIYLKQAEQLGDILKPFLAGLNRSVTSPSEQTNYLLPSYMTGFSGIALCFLRLSNPLGLPHQLSRAGFRVL
jgi:hypothetical protein